MTGIRILFRLGCGLLAIALLPAVALAEQDDQELAKKSQNPLGTIISLPFENNTSFSDGPEDAAVNVLNVKPVYPASLGSWNLINRGIVPLIYQGERFDGEGTESGLGDITYQAFFSPATPSGVIWGIGPALVFPTHTDDRLGTDKWSAGPAAVVLAKPGRWLFGGLVQHVWSYAGDDDEDNVNFSLAQYFINYNFDDGWYFSSTPTITANWAADSEDRWTIPFGVGFGRLVRFGTQPVDFKGQVFYNAEKPDGVSDMSLQLQVKFLFPK